MGRIFGPVGSRRLGRSLGIDVIPYKTCTYDCVYCECGKTSSLTCDRAEFYPLDEIMTELDKRLSEITEAPDVITLSGAGEPTLYSRMGELLVRIGDITDIPVAVITNSSLLFMPEVREELSAADIVIPSLDAALPEIFSRINRPHPRISIEEMLGGLEAFLSGYGGRVYMEILLLDGYNTDDTNLQAIGTFLQRVRLDTIQLNTAVRPGTVETVRPLGRKELERIRDYFGPLCEIVADVSSKTVHEDESALEHVISMIERRPCTASEISSALGINMPHAIKFLSHMVEEGRIRLTERGGRIYYTAVDRDSS